jgi:hypothetical protein
LDRLPDGSSRWVAHPARCGYSPATALCSVDAPAVVSLVSGDMSFIDSRCAGAALVFSGLNARHERQALAEFRSRPDGEGRFDLRLDTRGAEHLLLELVSHTETASIDYCLLEVRLRTLASRASGE